MPFSLVSKGYVVGIAVSAFIAVCVTVGFMRPPALDAQAMVITNDPVLHWWYFEILGTKKGHRLGVWHSRGDGRCRLALVVGKSGQTQDISQIIDVRFCQALQQTPEQVLGKAATP
jgi:hypothetical protein